MPFSSRSLTTFHNSNKRIIFRVTQEPCGTLTVEAPDGDFITVTRQDLADLSYEIDAYLAATSQASIWHKEK